MSSPQQKYDVPFNDAVTDETGKLARPWQQFYRFLQRVVDSLGYEKSFVIVNNQSAAADIEGLAFNPSRVTLAIVDFMIQRVTTSAGAHELLESGTFHAIYKPTSDSWSLFLAGTTGPNDSGVDFSITAGGQVQYVSTNITGTASISKLTFRARTFGGKNYQYSTVGR